MFRAYEIDNRNIDKPTFFRSLAKYFPDATTLYVGGDEITEDIKACYLSHSNDRGFDVADFQIWTHKCLFSQELMEKLAALSENHDFSELLERLSLYRENERLLQWYNVLHDTKIWVSDLVPEETVSQFAQESGLKYGGLTADDLCVCILLPDSPTVPMGVSKLYQEVYHTLEEIKRRGEPYWWLSANKCRVCGQWWLVAQEEHNDEWCLRRLNQETADRLLKEDLWPSDFDNYSTLLRLSLEAGRFVSYLDPEHSPLQTTMAQLARESPGILVSELAELLNLDLSTATMLAEKAVREEEVRITFDTSLGQEEVFAQINKVKKRLASAVRSVQNINDATNRPSRSLTTGETRVLRLIQQIYGNHNTIEKCILTDERDIAILVTNSHGHSVITVNLTFVADISREQNLTEKAIEVWLKP